MPGPTRAPSPRQLNRATLDRQCLLGRERIDVLDAIRRVVAVQAQEPASPYVVLWNRIEGFDPAELDRAFADRSVVKTPLMRITLHAVTADDYPPFHEAVTSILRAARLNDRRFTDTGLTTDDADALVDGLVEFGNEPRSKDEILAHLATVLGRAPEERLWWALRTYAPLIHSPVEPPWSFGRRPSYEAPPPGPDRPSVDDAVRRLIVRHLEGFGPATVDDVCQFTMLRKAIVRPAIEGLEADAEVVAVDGPFLDIPGGSIPADDTPAPPRLLAMWDNVLLAYADRSRVIPEEYRRHVIRTNGDTLPTVLVDGYVAGVWRPVDDGIEVTAFHDLDDDTWAALEVEAAALRAFLSDREPDVYSRYARWWDKLPPAERYVLARN